MGSTVRRGKRLLEGDGFVRFYRKHAQALLVFFARRVLEPELAHDLTAETFAQAFVSRRRFRGTTDAEAAGWLYAIARHELSRYLRRGYAERNAIERLGLSIEPLTVDERERIEELADLAGARKAIAEAVKRGLAREPRSPLPANRSPAALPAGRRRTRHLGASRSRPRLTWPSIAP